MDIRTRPAGEGAAPLATAAVRGALVPPPAPSAGAAKDSSHAARSSSPVDIGSPVAVGVATGVATGVAIALVVVAVYWPVRHFGYLNFDDNEYVTDNPFVRGGLSLENVRAAFTRARGGHYHPLTWVSHMLDVSLFGLRPGPAHVINVCVHALTTALFFLLVRRCGQGAGLAAFVALVFGLHPLRLESVAWIAERKDVLSLFFAVLLLHAWVSHSRRPSALAYVAAGACLACGLLCKPTLVMMPVLLLAFDSWPLGRSASWRRRLAEQAPFAVLSLASVCVTAWAQQREGALVDSARVGAGDRVAAAGVAYLAYLGKLFWPGGLGIFYPFVKYPPGVGPGVWVALVALSWFCLGRAHARRDRPAEPALAFAWFWFLVAPLPVIGFVQFGGQAFADRWTYLPHLGLVLGLAVVGGKAVPRPLRRPLGTVAVAACALLTRIELPHWEQSESLFRHTLAVSPDNFMAHTNLGNALDAGGKLDEAGLHYEEAARLNPTYPEALNNLGTLQARRGRMEEARQTFARALTIRPTMALARYNFGLAASRLGHPVEAATAWLIVLAADPGRASGPAGLAFNSLAFVAERVLAPACAAAALLPPTSESAGAFLEAWSRWRPQPGDEALAATLARVADCLR